MNSNPPSAMSTYSDPPYDIFMNQEDSSTQVPPPPSSVPETTDSTNEHLQQLLDGNSHSYGKSWKTATPKPFFGDKEDFRRFDRQVTVFLIANGASFREDQDKILFVLSFMEEGTAGLWASDYLDRSISRGEFGSWKSFRRELLDAFYSQNQAMNALDQFNKLKQDSGSARDFFLRLEQLASTAQIDLRMNDLLSISRIETGLNPTIIDKIYMGGNVPTEYDDYKRRAVMLDDLWRRRQDMKKGSSPWNELPKRTRPQDAVPRPKPKFESRGDPNAMDVDVQKAKRGAPTCYVCNEVGHIAKNCTKRANARSVTARGANTEAVEKTPAEIAHAEAWKDFPQEGA
jgi:hypothetical protein